MNSNLQSDFVRMLAYLSGIYVDSIDENQTDPSVTMETDDNETTPLLNKEFQKQEKHLKQKIYEQVARVDGTTRDLIQHGGKDYQLFL